MRRLAVALIAAGSLAGVSASAASADVIADLGLDPAGLVHLPAGFDPQSIDPLAINTSIGLPKPPDPSAPIDLTTKWMPVGKPLTQPSSASKASAKKRGKKRRHARRGS